ncbi:MAG: conjugal transfer protein TraN [Rhodospirillales bacterium]|nr:conjugal transfer protein TraN [Rhodospirillales bacterium]
MSARQAHWRMLTLTAAVCGCLLWVVAAAHAEDLPAEDSKAAARAIGSIGNAAAGTIARDSSNAATVPGYAGTDLPERAIRADALEDAARRRLADPDDPGGVAGQTVIRGMTSRPVSSVPAGDPLVRRAETVAATPQSPVHGADGLASGSVSDCGAGLRDAGAGGPCGSVTSCVGTGCETVRPEANTGFLDAATRLNMALELGGDEFDRQNLRFFAGERKACHIHLGGLADCCRNSGLLAGLADCSAEERELAVERNAGNTHYLGRYCSRRTLFGICIRHSRAWCVFGSKLGRILQEQGRRQLGIGWSTCRGFTVAEIEGLDFARLDLSEFTADLMDGSKEPSVSLPGAGATGDAMRARIRDFYDRGGS